MNVRKRIVSLLAAGVMVVASMFVGAGTAQAYATVRACMGEPNTYTGVSCVEVTSSGRIVTRVKVTRTAYYGSWGSHAVYRYPWGVHRSSTMLRGGAGQTISHFHYPNREIAVNGQVCANLGKQEPCVRVR